MAKRTSTKPPSGMRDFLPADLARRQFVVSHVRDVYERYGFVPLETPSIENLEILLGKYGEDEKLIYRLLHRGEVLQRALADRGDAPLGPDDLSDQALRYDLTVPLARVVAQYGELPKYFKRYQIQPVWRADRPGKGRFREFYQCDVDITGTRSPMAEAEVCGAACEVLDRLGFDDYELRINHRALLRALVRSSGIDTDLESTSLVAVDKLDKIGPEGVERELGERGIGSTAARRLLTLIVPPPELDNAARLERLAAELDEDGRAAVAELGDLLRLLPATPAGARARVWPQLARGLSYYTGAIFEVSVGDLGSSIAGGGRYDGLIGMFGKQQVPAVGLSLGLERILVVMEERGMYPADLRVGAELLLCWRGIDQADVLRVAHRLRAGGVAVEVFPEDAKLGKQLQYGDSPGVELPWVGIVAEDELAQGTITLKHLPSGAQYTVVLDDAVATLRATDRTP